MERYGSTAVRIRGEERASAADTDLHVYGWLLTYAAWPAAHDARRTSLATENLRREALTADSARAVAAARLDALRPRWWDALLLGLAAIALVGAHVHRWRAFHPLAIDVYGIRAGGARKLLWEDLADARWAKHEVVLVGRDGTEVVLEGLDLRHEEVGRAEAISRRLLERGTRSAERPGAREALADLVARSR